MSSRRLLRTVSRAGNVFVSAVATDDYFNATEDDSAVLIAGTTTGLAANTTITITLDDADGDTNADHTFTAATDSSGNWTTDSSDLTAARVQGTGRGRYDDYRVST